MAITAGHIYNAYLFAVIYHSKPMIIYVDGIIYILSMTTNRRNFITGAGFVIAGTVGFGTVLADEHEVPIVIAEINAENETVVLENTGDTDVDLSGYVIDWEHNDNKNQTDSLPEETTVPAGGKLTIASGYTDAESDVTYDYDNGRINNEDPDVIALLTASEELVATSDDEATGGEGGNDTDDGNETGNDTEDPEDEADEDNSDEEDSDEADEEDDDDSTADNTEDADGSDESTEESTEEDTVADDNC
ncbi:lamin tail domain-containing protein [Natrinema soli]|uniref:Lamin tail domain-containing protein n=1 Tax=Natrinema soli TaxID=1930624 RepID=A0ABD5SM64_9EURY|nr:lamin tail domain-containing protein [Natrinema soli]